MAGAYTIDSIDAHDGMKMTKGHAGSIILPSLIALLETSGRDYDDEELMTCLVLGYEIAIRDGIALHDSVPDYHTSGAWAAVGVAALGARILGLDHQHMEEAIGIAEHNGPRSQMMRAIDYPTMVKDGAGWGDGWCFRRIARQARLYRRTGNNRHHARSGQALGRSRLDLAYCQSVHQALASLPLGPACGNSGHARHAKQ